MTQNQQYPQQPVYNPAIFEDDDSSRQQGHQGQQGRPYIAPAEREMEAGQSYPPQSGYGQHGGYGNNTAPSYDGYGSTTPAYGSAPTGYGSTAPAYGSAPSAYGSAPTGYGSAPATYGSSPETYGGAHQYMPHSYGPDPSMYQPGQKMNVMALVSFISSLVSFITGGLLAIVGVITGHIAMNQLKQSEETGKGFAIAGLVISYAQILLLILLIGFVVIVGIIGVSTSP